MAFTKPFQELSKSDAAIAGGKGASLGEMTQVGIPVPPGFVVLSESFERFIEETDLNVEIDNILHGVDPAKMHTVEHASETIQKLILEAEMPEDIAEKIKGDFSALGAEYVAVRSSATAEDSDSAAWAGQLDSFLNTTEETLLQNVQRCWASLFTPRAIFYRFEKGLHETKISVAVVVQKMVESEVSGIAFSVHPVTEDRNQLIIEAGYGLGEAIVSGQITPDSYVVEKAPRRIIDKNIVEQERGIYRRSDPSPAPLPEGSSRVLEGEGWEKKEANEWRSIPTEKRNLQKLSDEQIFELSDLIVKIENHYGFPCDIEWAYESGVFYIVQSRPITTLSSKSSHTGSDNSEYVWHVFRNRYIPAVLPILSYWSWSIKDEVGEKAGLLVNVWDKGNYQAIWEERGYMSVRDYSLEYLTSHLKKLSELRNTGVKTGGRVVEMCREFSARANEATYEDLLNFLELFDEAYNEFTKKSMLLWLFSGDAIHEEIGRKLSGMSESDRTGFFAAFSVSSEKSYSQKEEEEFLDLVKAARDKGIDDASVAKMIGEFSKKYFWFPYEYVGPVVWDEQAIKKRLSDVLKGEIPAPLIAVAEERPAVDVPDDVRGLFQVLQTVTLMQDDRKMANAQICYYLNDVILGAFAKRIGAPIEHLRYLETNILRQFIDGRIDLEAFKEKLGERADYFVVVQDGEDYSAYSGAEGRKKLRGLGIEGNDPISTTGLSGQSAFAGKATGHARIVRSSSDRGDFVLGDVLVTGMTTPDFVPLVKIATAIVTDEGGITCHAAIIARELKKPCIIGTKIATQVLHDGDLVEVDADNGVVRILERAEDEKSENSNDQSRPITTLIEKTEKRKTNGDVVQRFVSLMVGRKLWPPLNNYTFFGQGSAFNTKKYFDNYYPALPPLHLLLIAKEGESMQFLPSDTLEYCSRYIFENYLTGSDEAKKRFHDFDGVEKYVSELYEEYKGKKVLETSTDESLILMDSIRDKIWHLNCFIMFTLYFDKEICLDVLKNTKYPIATEQLDALWDKATHPAVESFEKAQQRSVLKTIAENESKECIIENARFIFTNYFGAEDLETVSKKIDNEYGAITDKRARLKLDQLDTELELEKSKFNDWFGSLSKEEQHLVWYLQRIIEYRDRRKNLFAKAYVIWWLIYEKVLREAEIDHSLITYVQFDELIRGAEYLRSIKASIESRKNGSALLIEFDGMITIESLDYDEAKIQLTDFYAQSAAAGQKEGEIKGQTGSPGIVRGMVKIVLNASKSEKFKDGDILVTGMTRPEFVPLMKRSLAVITDEGGITCHAAIISRELKIPCVIGTKIATQVLHDGDLVEVDADHGVVRVLERAEDKK